MDRLEERWRLLQGLQNIPANQESDAFEATDIYQQQSFDLLHSDHARSAFDIHRESPATRDRYGRNPLGQNLLLARRLIQSGVRLVNVVAWTGLAAGEKFVSLETWDMHGNANVGIFENGWNGLPFALPRTDQAVATLLEDLSERGLLDSTLVVLIGEFGRTPVISKGAKRIGRDHWPNCYSAMVAGAGIRGGNVYGESDSRAALCQIQSRHTRRLYGHAVQGHESQSSRTTKSQRIHEPGQYRRTNSGTPVETSWHFPETTQNPNRHVLGTAFPATIVHPCGLVAWQQVRHLPIATPTIRSNSRILSNRNLSRTTMARRKSTSS